MTPTHEAAADHVEAFEALPSATRSSEVARQMLDLFISGTIEPGERLPSERELAKRLMVGRSAIREALAALEIIGVVDVRPGSGSYLRGTMSDLLPQTLRWGLLIGEKSTRELLELRSGLEIYVARLAPDKASEETIERMNASISLMAESLDDLATFARADAEFHQALADAAGNSILNDLLHVARSLLRVYAERAVHDPEHARRALEEHQAIANAVTARDSHLCASLMSLHMTTASERIIAANAPA